MGVESDKMKADGLRTGEIIEIKWRQRSLHEETTDRTVKMVLLNPVLANIGTMDQRLSGGNCQVFHDTHHRANREIPYTKHYEIKWLKMCESQGNLQIISRAQLKDEANK